MHRYAQSQQPPRAARPPRVDRVKTCPSLLRVFVKAGSHHADSEFSTNQLPTRDEHQVYTWRDSTVREILNLVRDADPALRATTLPLARFSVRVVYWDANADRYTSQEIAVVQNRDLLQPPVTGGAAHRQGPPPPGSANPRLDRTLADAKLVVGDFLDIAYIAPDSVISAAAPPMAGPSAGHIGSRAGPPPVAPGHGANGHVFGRRDASTWGASASGRPQQAPSAGGARAPLPRSGPNQWGAAGQRGPSSGPPRHGPPQDQGWGPRRSSATGGRSFEDRDRPPPPRRRGSSRSPSPMRNVRNGYDRPPHHRRSPSPARRSASPPSRRRADDTDVSMRD